jgi:phosphopantetheinyl transferase (holo-ACP synthase)
MVARHAAGGALASAVDLVAVARAERLAAENPGALMGMCTARELAEFAGGTRAGTQTAKRRERRIAALLALKEAALKALGLGADEADWRELEFGIERGDEARLSVTLRGRIAEYDRSLGAAHWLCSAAATRSLAVAWVVRQATDGEGN